MARLDDLLVSAAKSLKGGGIPLSPPWLDANEVTFNEAHDVAESMATAIHVYRAVLNLALEQSVLDSKEERSLAEIVRSMGLRQGGVISALVVGARLEEEAQKENPPMIHGLHLKRPSELRPLGAAGRVVLSESARQHCRPGANRGVSCSAPLVERDLVFELQP